jgi:hypothetical protein
MPRTLLVIAGLTGSLLAAGCQSSGDIINKSLAGPHPAKVESGVTAAPPPVDPAALTIAATPLGPTETPSVDPKPILPKMDAQFNERKMPAGYEQFTQPTTRAAERPELPAAPEVQR